MILFCAFLCACSSKDISLVFEVSNPIGSSVIVAHDGTMDVVNLDEDGRGVWTLSGPEAVYAVVGYGMETKQIYTERGKAVVNFDGVDFTGTFVFDGKTSAAVDYLNSVTLPAPPEDAYVLDFVEYKAQLNRREKDAVTLLEAHDFRGCGNFAEVETGKIMYSYACALLMYPVGHAMVTGDYAYEPSEEYYEELAAYFVATPELLPAHPYKEFLAEAAHQLDVANRDVRQLYPKLLAEMRYIVSQFEDAEVREAMVHHICLPYIEQFGTEGTEEMLNIYNTYVKNPGLATAFRERYDRWDLTMPGKLSPDFKAVDISGKIYSLADFKGKYVYVDVWATWCGPCRREIPALKKMESRFEGKDVVFVSLSVDQDKEAWEAKVHEGEMGGFQLYLGPDSSFQKTYKINGIPRFILIDRDGKIINSNMTRPTQAETAETLSTLLD